MGRHTRAKRSSVWRGSTITADAWVIEVKDDSQLPQINRDLEKLWKEAGNKAKLDELINSRRTESGGKPTDVNTKAVLRWKQDVGKLDRSIPLNHVMQWKIRRRRIQGGHKHEHMIDMQAASICKQRFGGVTLKSGIGQRRSSRR